MRLGHVVSKSRTWYVSVCDTVEIEDTRLQQHLKRSDTHVKLAVIKTLFTPEFGGGEGGSDCPYRGMLVRCSCSCEDRASKQMRLSDQLA